MKLTSGCLRCRLGRRLLCHGCLGITESGYRFHSGCAVKEIIKKSIHLRRCTLGSGLAGNLKNKLLCLRFLGLLLRLFLQYAGVLNRGYAYKNGYLSLRLVTLLGICRKYCRGGNDLNLTDGCYTLGAGLVGCLGDKTCNAYSILLSTLLQSTMALRLLSAVLGDNCLIVLKRSNNLLVDNENVLSYGLVIKLNLLGLVAGYGNAGNLLPLNAAEIVVYFNGLLHLYTVWAGLCHSAASYRQRNNNNQKYQNYTDTEV